MKTKADKPNFNFNGKDFIPLACHYNKNTLLTKNGQLIQVIAITDIHKLGNKITGYSNIREILRNSIQQHLKSNRFALWISTIRTTQDISDDAPYNNQFCKELNEVWQKHNSWDDRLVNNLYISIVYHHASLEVKDVSSFINSLSISTIHKFHDEYLNKSIALINNLTDNILKDLEIFKAKKLSIVEKNGEYYTELASFLSQLIYLDKNEQKVQNIDLSLSLTPDSYAVGPDQIELKQRDVHKIVTIIGIKEYQETPSEVLDKFLQLPCKMVITEIVTLIDKKTALKSFQFTDQILKVSKDEELREVSYIKELAEEEADFEFCNQQINIAIIENDVANAEKNVVTAAKFLSNLGIVNVKEDIEIENAFWSRIPGNFHLINRYAQALKKYAAAFSSTYNFPTGNHKNVWGNAVTILKTFKTTPYFFNFHSGNSGHTAIFSTKNNGKTILLNFLLAQATKYNPEILYLSHSSKSQAFIELLDGVYLNHLSLPNPLTFLDESEVLEWLKIFCGNATNKLSDNENLLLAEIVKYFMSLPPEERLLNNIKQFDFSNFQDADRIKKRLGLFAKGQYEKILFKGDVDLNLIKVCGIELSFFTDKSFELANYPKQEKLIPSYLANLEIHTDLRSAVMFLLLSLFGKKNNSQPKILVLADLDSLISGKSFEQDIAKFLDEFKQNNGIVLSSIKINNYKQLHNTDFWRGFQNSLATKIVLAEENMTSYFQEFMGLDNEEMSLLSSLPAKERFFIVKQEDFTISVELNLAAYPWLLKILSQNPYELEKYKAIKNSQPKENLLSAIYEAFKEH